MSRLDRPIRSLIVDDEALARRGLELRLRGAPDFEIVAQCANGREARLAAALDHIREQFRQRHALRQRAQLVAMLARVQGAGEVDLSAFTDETPPAAPRHPEVLPIRTGRETVRVKVITIDWIDAAGDYMRVHADGRTHVVRATSSS